MRMFMRSLFALALLMLGTAAFADYPAGAEILKRIDDNLSADNTVMTAKMVIHGRRNSRTVESRSWSKGTEKSFTEYLAPAREKGIKMLKLADRLWTYSPATDRTIQIAGHMLRQSVMGSDLSYEDMMENPKLSEIYDAVVTGEETIASRSYYIVTLDAIKTDVAYHRRIIWVDQERYVPLREELYAKSGKLLKTTDLDDFRLINERWYPFRVVYKDVLKDGKGTEFIIETIEFNVEIPAHTFSKASLRR